MNEYGVKRLSMNTNIKNARIFDEDSWDAESAGLIVRKEPDSYCIETEINSEELGNEDHTHINQEPTEQLPLVAVKKEYPDNGESEFHSEPNKELDQSCYLCKEIKKEPVENVPQFEGLTSGANQSCYFCKKIKKEPVENVPQFEGLSSGALDYLNTPIKSEFIRDESNPSPFNKELFKHFSLDSPQAKADTSENPKEELRATVARTVFKQEFSDMSSDSSSYNTDDNEQLRKIPAKDRLGPKLQDIDSHDNRIPVKRRLGSKVVEDDYVPRKKIQKFEEEYESDPAVLRRRQKQIDYGKNTLGYDQYREKVPLDHRSREDPKTPNKYLKYSRRGWDGLIKQWKLKLHQFDPKDS